MSENRQPRLAEVLDIAPDAAEWSESDDSPRWLSMADLPYRGGGVMHRRTGTRWEES